MSYDQYAYHNYMYKNIIKYGYVVILHISHVEHI